ncbi:MAG: hypothetical protein M0Z94_06195 [Dehalococcoidales bacterium]|nr:hypothetical protein [Dehalococcoidales bacterium]
MAGEVAFLCSNQTDYVTGSVIVVDGGTACRMFLGPDLVIMLADADPGDDS